VPYAEKITAIHRIINLCNAFCAENSRDNHRDTLSSFRERCARSNVFMRFISFASSLFQLWIVAENTLLVER